MKGKSWILKMIYVFLGLIALFLVYSHYEYRHIKIRTIEIQSKDIPEEFNGKRILFVADFQYDTMSRYNRKQQKKAIELINAQKKDMVLLGGDYATWEKNIPKFYEDAKDIKIPELGVYAIYGNHEYPGEEETAENMKKLGFNLLVNENRKITINNESIYIAGVTDLWHGSPDARKALEGIKKEDFVLFLTLSNWAFNSSIFLVKSVLSTSFVTALSWLFSPDWAANFPTTASATFSWVFTILLAAGFTEFSETILTVFAPSSGLLVASRDWATLSLASTVPAPKNIPIPIRTLAAPTLNFGSTKFRTDEKDHEL